MKLGYRLFGVRYATGHTDWHLIRQGLLAILFVCLFFAALDHTITYYLLKERFDHLQMKLNLREQQITRCLNGQAIGYVTIGNKQTYTVCRMAEEITVVVK